MNGEAWVTKRARQQRRLPADQYRYALAKYYASDDHTAQVELPKGTGAVSIPYRITLTKPLVVRAIDPQLPAKDNQALNRRGKPLKYGPTGGPIDSTNIGNVLDAVRGGNVRSQGFTKRDEDTPAVPLFNPLMNQEGYTARRFRFRESCRVCHRPRQRVDSSKRCSDCFLMHLGDTGPAKGNPRA